MSALLIPVLFQGQLYYGHKHEYYEHFKERAIKFRGAGKAASKRRDMSRSLEYGEDLSKFKVEGMYRQRMAFHG